MSHHIYKTEALILGSRNSGESNRLFFLLTKELGFVVAVSQGARNLKSKLRYNLQDFNLANLEMVRGKEIWRITGAETVKNYSKLFLTDERKIKTTARIFSVLRRLLHGESKNKLLFNDILEFLEFTEKENLDPEKLPLLEILANLKIFNRLGYGSPEKSFKLFIENRPSVKLLDSLGMARKKAVAEVNRALRESHL